jgi:heme A synthase
MRGLYRGLALAVAALVALQAAFIAYFISGLAKWIQKDGGVLDASVFAEGSTVEVGGEAGIALHAISGTFVIPLVALILVIVSFFAKIPGGTKWALIVFGVVILQYALAFFARLATLPALGALHGLNALILFGVAVTAAMRVRTATRAAVPDTATTSAAYQ